MSAKIRHVGTMVTCKSRFSYPPKVNFDKFPNQEHDHELEGLLCQRKVKLNRKKKPPEVIVMAHKDFLNVSCTHARDGAG